MTGRKMKAYSPDRFDADLVTENFYPDWMPYTINCGCCFDWAYIALKLFHEVDIKLWSNKDHSFIKIGRRFYDSESPNGVFKWERLHCNIATNAQHSRQVSLATHKRIWGEYKSRSHWTDLDKKIKTFLKEM
jgi:hypothetical protein